MNIELLNILATGGLGGVQDNLVDNWIGPAFFIVVAGFAIKFIISRQFRELAGFLAIAAVVALLVFNSEGLFESGGVFYNIANGFSSLLGTGGSGSGSGGSGGAGGIIQFFTRK